MGDVNIDELLIDILLSEEDDESISKLHELLANKISPNYSFSLDGVDSEKTLLEHCCRFGLIKYIEILIQQNVQLEIFTAEKETPLHLLAYNIPHDCRIDAKIIYERILSELKGFVNYQNDKGQTALMLAVKSGSISIVNLLIQYGANVHILDHFDNNCLHFALMDNHPINLQIDLIGLLVSNHANAYQVNKLCMTPIDYYLTLHPPLANTPFSKILK